MTIGAAIEATIDAALLEIASNPDGIPRRQVFRALQGTLISTMDELEVYLRTAHHNGLLRTETRIRKGGGVPSVWCVLTQAGLGRVATLTEGPRGKPTQPTLRISARELSDYLARWRLTDANFAKIMGVSLPTIRNWLAAGVTGTSAHFIAYLSRIEASPYDVARILAVQISTRARQAEASEPAPMPAKGEGDAVGIPTTTEPPAGSRWPKRPG